MEKYIEQLLADIAFATENVIMPFAERDLQLNDWISPDEEDRTAPIRNLEEWTGIRQEYLPPQEILTEEQIHLLLAALKKMLDAYNWSFILQIEVPERIQYATIRDNFNQQAKIKLWHMGFFELCRDGTAHGTCALGEYCECKFFAEFFSGMIDEGLSPEEERARQLEFEINHLKKKYGSEWRKYYPYHLDAEYDDENGNPYDYGFGNDEDDEDSNDDWWKK